eukprot:s3348_g12.t1
MHTLPENNDEAFALGLATLVLDSELLATTNAGVAAAVDLDLCLVMGERTVLPITQNHLQGLFFLALFGSGLRFSCSFALIPILPLTLSFPLPPLPPLSPLPLESRKLLLILVSAVCRLQADAFLSNVSRSSELPAPWDAGCPETA